MSPTGRINFSKPNIQNVPGSWADVIDKALERGDNETAHNLISLCRKIAGVSENND